MKQILIFMFLIVSLGANATNYYIRNGGNDAANGLSDATAWATATKVAGKTFLTGDTVFFRRGDTFVSTVIIYPNGGTTFAAYGTGAKPIIDAMADVGGWSTAGNWTNTSGNIWRLTISPSHTRLWVDGTEIRRAFSSSIDATDKWYSGGGYLYYYSAINPASTFSTMRWNGIASTFFIQYGGGNVSIINLDLRGSSIPIRITNNCDNILIDGCAIGYNIDKTGVAIGNSEQGYSYDNVKIRNCTFDSNDAMMYVGIEAQSAFAGVYMLDNGLNFEVSNCTFKNWGHSGIDVEFYSTVTNSSIKIFNNHFSNPTIYYGRAIGMIYIKGSCEIYNNIAFNCPTPTQINGPGLLFHNNVIDNNSREIILPAKPYQIGTGIALLNDHDINLSGTKIYNNTIMNAYDIGINMGGFDGTQTYDSIEFINNIIYNCGQSERSASFQMKIYAQTSMGANVYKNNLFYRSGITDVVSYRSVAKTATTFNSANGSNGDVISGNIQSEPLLNTNYTLQVGSPAIDAGINVGLPFMGVTPDIGAFEYGVIVGNRKIGLTNGHPGKTNGFIGTVKY